MKKLLASLVILYFLLMPISAWAYNVEIYESPKPVTVHVDGKYLASDTLPVIDNGRTLIPLRAAAQALGATVDWDQSTKTARLTKDQTAIIFIVDAKSYSVNGTPKSLDVPLQIKDGRIMLPMRAFAEALGVQIDWIADTSDVSITTEKEVISPPSLPTNTPASAYWILKKYYVQSDANDPYVGSWTRFEKVNDYGITVNTHSFLFVSKLTDKDYQIIDIKIGPDIDNDWRVAAFNTSAWIQENFLRREFYGNNLYYRGSPTGFEGNGYNDYLIKDHKLVQFRSIATLIDTSVSEMNFVYNRF